MQLCSQMYTFINPQICCLGYLKIQIPFSKLVSHGRKTPSFNPTHNSVFVRFFAYPIREKVPVIKASFANIHPQLCRKAQYEASNVNLIEAINNKFYSAPQLLKGSGNYLKKTIKCSSRFKVSI